MPIRDYNLTMNGLLYWIRLTTKIDLNDSTHIYIENSNKIHYAFTPLQCSWRRVKDLLDDFAIYDITERKNQGWIHSITIIKRRD